MPRPLYSNFKSMPPSTVRDVELLDPDIDAEDDHADVARIVGAIDSDGAVELEQ